MLCLAPTADAGYRRTIVGYDSRGNPIVQVTWEADHLTQPRTIYNNSRQTYSTSGRRDSSTMYYPPTIYYPYYTPVHRAPEREPYSAYSTYDPERENSD
jgi:hypothetical protein